MPSSWDAKNNPYVLSTHVYTAEDAANDREFGRLKERICQLEEELDVVSSKV